MSSRATVSPPIPESKTPMQRAFVEVMAMHAAYGCIGNAESSGAITSVIRKHEVQRVTNVVTRPMLQAL